MIQAVIGFAFGGKVRSIGCRRRKTHFEMEKVSGKQGHPQSARCLRAAAAIRLILRPVSDPRMHNLLMVRGNYRLAFNLRIQPNAQ